MRLVSVLSCAALLALGSVPCLADEAASKIVSMTLQGRYDGASQSVAADLTISNNLGFAVDVAGQYRIILDGKELRTAPFDTANVPRLSYHFDFDRYELTDPLPNAMQLCAIVDYTLRVVDRNGKVRELHDILMGCRTVPTRVAIQLSLADSSSEDLTLESRRGR